MAIRFKIKCTLDYVVDGQSEFLLNIQPAQTTQQQLLSEHLELDGCHEHVLYTEPGMGNRFIKLSAGAGHVAVRYDADVLVRHHMALPFDVNELAVRELPPEVLPYLLPSRYCESDKLFAFACQHFGTLAPGYGRVEAVCDWIHRHVRFVPGVSNWTTSALDTLAAGAGVCRDFAHLTIALLRALNIPARFVAGYDYGADPALGPTDFHAYVEAFLDGHWYIFDSSRLCPRNGLVRIATGYDAADTAFATIYGPTRYAGMKLDIMPLNEIGQVIELVDDPSAALSTSSLEDMPRVHEALQPTCLAVIAGGGGLGGKEGASRLGG